MKAFTFLLSAVLSLGMLSAQNMLIFQPDSGANDGTDIGGLLGGKDTWVNRYAPGDNYGNMYVVLASPRSNCNPSDYKSYYQFDVSGLPEVVDSVFFGVTHLPHDTYCYSNCNADFYFYYCASPWDEMTLIQNSLPAENPTAFYGPIPISYPNDFGNREYEITTAYNYWKDTSNANYGFTVYSPTVGCNNASVGFYTYSSDDSVATNRPYLKIYYPSQAGLEENAFTLDVFPNPFGDFLLVNLTGIETFYMADLTGRRFQITYDASSKSINTASLAKGIYFLYLESHGKQAVKKIIKQ